MRCGTAWDMVVREELFLQLLIETAGFLGDESFIATLVAVEVLLYQKCRSGEVKTWPLMSVTYSCLSFLVVTKACQRSSLME